MDKLHAINLFCKVIETNSFTQAAQQMQMSLAMASKLVSQLEEHLNVRLLNRTTRKITPTEAGLLYYQRCVPILSELQVAEDSVSNITSTLQGKINISLPLDFGTRFIAPHLGKFMQTYPNVQLNLDFSDRRVDVVAEGYDLVLRIGKLEDSSIVAKQIARSRIMLVASPDYLTRHGTPKTLDDLAQHHLSVYASHPVWYFTDQQGISTKYKPQGSLFSNNGYASVQMAKAGLTLINIPKFLVKEELESGELVQVLEEYTQPMLDISVLYPHRRHLSPKVKAIRDFLENLLNEQKSWL